MQRRTSSIILCVIGAGLMALTAHGSGSSIETGTGIFLVGTGLFGLYHSGEETSKSCASHIIKYVRQEVEKRFPLTG